MYVGVWVCGKHSGSTVWLLVALLVHSVVCIASLFTGYVVGVCLCKQSLCSNCGVCGVSIGHMCVCVCCVYSICSNKVCGCVKPKQSVTRCVSCTIIVHDVCVCVVSNLVQQMCGVGKHLSAMWCCVWV